MKPPEGSFWIGSDHPFDLHETYLDFRAGIDLPHGAATAVLHLSADSRYRLWVNGRFAGRGPERSWPASMAVDARDIAPLLRAGRNLVEVQVYSPGYSHFAHVHRAAAGLIAWAEIDGRAVLHSNRDWQVRRDRSWSAEVPRVSIYGSGVEMRDRTVAPGGWAPARIVQPPEGPVWGGLRPRVTPLLSEERRALESPCATFFGPTPEGSDGPDPHAGLRQALADLLPAPVPDSLPAGHSAIWVFDLGSPRVCVAGAVLTAGQGDLLTVSYAERRKDGALLISDPSTWCRMRPTDRSRLAEGRQEVEGFTLRGGRFLIFRLDSRAGGRPAPAFHARLPAYPLRTDPSRAAVTEGQPRPGPDPGPPPAPGRGGGGGGPGSGPGRGSLAAAADPDGQAPALEARLPGLPADPSLSGVAALCARTTLACLQDGFVDSVWRESSQWLGDVVAQAHALLALSDDARPLRLAIEQAAEGAAADGILPSVLPGEAPAYVVTDYNFAWVELLHLWTRHPGRDDESLIPRHWPALVRLLDRFEADRSEDGLIRSQPGRRLFLDWSAMDRGEPNLTYNLRHIHALTLAAGLAEARGAAEAGVWRARARRAAASVRARLHVPEGWRESPGGAPASQLACAFLILTGLAEGAEAATLAGTIAARSLDPDPAALPALASPFMHLYLFQALDRLGRRDDILRIIAFRWGRWAEAGEPTAWENWAIDFPDGSACHGFSAHPLYWLRQGD